MLFRSTTKQSTNPSKFLARVTWHSAGFICLLHIYPIFRAWLSEHDYSLYLSTIILFQSGTRVLAWYWRDCCVHRAICLILNCRKAVIAAQPTPHDPLSAFQAEISAIEAENAAAAAAVTEGSEPPDGPATPEDLEFEDDDGTMYVWDRNLRKYIPADAAAGGAGNGIDPAAAAAGGGGGGAAGYDIDAMTYTAEEEVVPSLEALRAAEAAAAAAEAHEAAAALAEEALDPKERARLERKVRGLGFRVS